MIAPNSLSSIVYKTTQTISKKFMKKIDFTKGLFYIFLALIWLVAVACSTETDTTPIATATAPTVVENIEETSSSTSAGYPEASTASEDGSGYVPAETENSELLDSPPNPDIEAPQPSSGGAVYGILVQEVTDQGFLPLLPRSFYLAEVVLNSEGEPALIRRNIESPKAELFQTGVFVFNNVPPGDYGLIADLGFSELTINDETGNPIIIKVEEGKTQNLEQVFVELP